MHDDDGSRPRWSDASIRPHTVTTSRAARGMHSAVSRMLDDTATTAEMLAAALEAVDQRVAAIGEAGDAVTARLLAIGARLSRAQAALAAAAHDDPDMEQLRAELSATAEAARALAARALIGLARASRLLTQEEGHA